MMYTEKSYAGRITSTGTTNITLPVDVIGITNSIIFKSLIIFNGSTSSDAAFLISDQSGVPEIYYMNSNLGVAPSTLIYTSNNAQIIPATRDIKIVAGASINPDISFMLNYCEIPLNLTNDLQTISGSLSSGVNTILAGTVNKPAIIKGLKVFAVDVGAKCDIETVITNASPFPVTDTILNFHSNTDFTEKELELIRNDASVYLNAGQTLKIVTATFTGPIYYTLSYIIPS